MRKLVLTCVPHRHRDVVRGWLLAVMSRFLAGRNVECMVCRQTSRRWVSLGFPEQVCPHCNAFSRQRLLALYLERELRLGRRPLRMLHFAPEVCLMRYFQDVPGLTYIAADLDPPAGGVKMDITKVDLDPGSVDVVICSHVLEHVIEDAVAISELRRVLRPDGAALIMGPVDYSRPATYEDPAIVTPRARLAAFGQSDHVRIYGSDFDSRLQAGGFHVDANRYGLTMPEPARTRSGLSEDEILYVCKPAHATLNRELR
jgi:SAM-dependent methyltransferase